MIIPTKVKIGGFNYDVVKSETVINEDNEACYGIHDFSNCKINIATKYADQIQQAAFIHEVIHAVSDVYHLNLNEKTVEILGEALYQVIVDNPNVFQRK